MAVLKRPKSLQASALNFLKRWLAKLLAEDSVTDSRLDELHEFLSPWLGLVSATLLDEIMQDSVARWQNLIPSYPRSARGRGAKSKEGKGSNFAM